MPDLGQLMGTLLSCLAHARRIADEETAAIAEYYRTNPLLEGMSLPRVRVPELVIDMPMLIEGSQDAEANILQDPVLIKAAVLEELQKSTKREGLTLTPAIHARFESEVNTELARMKTGGGERGYPRETVVKAVDLAFARTLGEEAHDPIPAGQVRRITTDLRSRAADVAFKKVGVPPRINASILTEDIKNRAPTAVVARIRLVLKEEGLEWSVAQNEDGTVSRRLSPE